MAMSDRVNEMKAKADRLAEQARELAEVQGPQSVAGKAQRVADEVDQVTSKGPETDSGQEE
jgi:hypothetical protein